MLDWDDIRFFLAVARHGNLSAAAKHLRVSQPTVGRRLASLEASVGVRLLDRKPNGYVLTPAGREVMAKAERLDADVHALASSVSGRDIRLSGQVRVTCAETMATHVLAPSFAALHERRPGIVVELIPDARELSLARREAELSVRLLQPAQHDLVVRRVGSLAFGLYASPLYLETHPPLDFDDGCVGHRLIGQSDDLEQFPQFDWFSEVTSQARVAFRTNSHESAVSAALNGAGLACLARVRADRQEGLVRVIAPTAPPSTGIWLAVHRDNRDVARIRAVMDHIVETMCALRASLLPDGEADPDTVDAEPDHSSSSSP